MLLLIMPVMLLCGCDDVQTSKTGTNHYVGNFRFIKVERGEEFCILVDKETRVMYLYNTTSYQGGLTAILNSDGTPMLWEGELKGE